MATRRNLVKRRQKHKDNSFVYSTDSTVVEEKLFGQAEEDEDSRVADDGPVVFICGKCKLPVGDSMSWDGSEDGQNQIRLKRELEGTVGRFFLVWFVHTNQTHPNIYLLLYLSV